MRPVGIKLSLLVVKIDIKFIGRDSTGVESPMKRQDIRIIIAHVENGVITSQPIKTNLINQNGAFQRRLTRFVFVQVPATPRKALRLDIVKPDNSAARAIFPLDHVVEFPPLGLAGLVALNPGPLIINRPGHCGQMGAVCGMTLQAVNIGCVLRLYQAQYQVWPLNPDN